MEKFASKAIICVIFLVILLVSSCCLIFVWLNGIEYDWDSHSIDFKCLSFLMSFILLNFGCMGSNLNSTPTLLVYINKAVQLVLEL